MNGLDYFERICKMTAASMTPSRAVTASSMSRLPWSLISHQIMSISVRHFRCTNPFFSHCLNRLKPLELEFNRNKSGFAGLNRRELCPEPSHRPGDKRRTECTRFLCKVKVSQKSCLHIIHQYSHCQR